MEILQVKLHGYLRLNFSTFENLQVAMINYIDNMLVEFKNMILTIGSLSIISYITCSRYLMISICYWIPIPTF